MLDMDKTDVLFRADTAACETCLPKYNAGGLKHLPRFSNAGGGKKHKRLLQNHRVLKYAPVGKSAVSFLTNTATTKNSKKTET